MSWVNSRHSNPHSMPACLFSSAWLRAFAGSVFDSEAAANWIAKGGTAGRWQTPFQKARHAEKAELGRTLEVNDAGIWVTYARGMKGKAMREFKALCNQVWWLLSTFHRTWPCFLSTNFSHAVRRVHVWS